VQALRAIVGGSGNGEQAHAARAVTAPQAVGAVSRRSVALPERRIAVRSAKASEGAVAKPEHVIPLDDAELKEF